MADRLRTDSSLSRRIVFSFLDFLRSVELAEDVDREGLDVARECLEQAFKLNHASIEEQTPHGMLAELFKNKFHPDKECESSQNKGGDEEAESSANAAVSRDELFSQFYAALDKSNFFTPTLGGNEDHAQVAKATKFFEQAAHDIEKSVSQKLSRKSLASSFKTLGNQAMESKSYVEAVDLYTCAIALEDNAIYYCNRAAAHTQLRQFDEATKDCQKCITLNPSYSKGYSRLGLVHYEQRKYPDAMAAFHKALQLDPGNESLRSNLEMANQRWLEEPPQGRPGQARDQRGIAINIPLGEFAVFGGADGLRVTQAGVNGN
ncbi:tetratricopeptide repeat (TPR)-like superfamily protein isoform X2 [Wolffia australiana]